MKSESGPLKYRLARKPLYRSITHDSAEQIGYEYVLQGWFEWETGDEGFKKEGEWRTLDTVDLED